ncbi:MAG: hypothetical protein CMK03_06865 [Ponticaulis sp.]|nr:hypothetical protein [Ponticaulis sp.]
MNLNDYLTRISYSAPLRVDLATLNGLIEAHVRAVPFENLDIYAERPVEWSLDAAYDEIVTRKQGGWCFEMNTLFEWVLSEIGFDVTRLSGGVRREKAGDVALGNHLCLMVSLDRDYLVDVGFGGSQISAIALEEAETLHRPLRMALLDAGDGYWRGVVWIWCVLRANRFAYAVTDCRLIILNDFFPYTIRSVPPDEIEYVVVQTIDGNEGSIFLRPFVYTFRLHLFGSVMPRKIMNASDIHTAAKHLNALLAQKQKNVAQEEQIAQSEQSETSKPPETEEEKAARQGLFRTWG